MTEAEYSYSRAQRNRNRSRRRRKRKSPLGFLCLFMIILFAAYGCYYLSTKLDKQFDIANSFILSDSKNSLNTVDAFAYDLCVVGDMTESVDSSFNAEAGLLCSYNGGNAIFAKDAFEKLNPASTTKLLTALVALENGNLSDMITVPEEAVITEQGASLAGVEPGDVLSLEQLLYGLMLPSGNDAANAIAKYLGGGSIDQFIDMMNERAYSIGATDTHFVNANGLTATDHLTTAYDLYLIIHKAMEYDKFREIIGTTTYIANYTKADGSEVSKTWSNSNRYLVGDADEPDGIEAIGGKTGTTLAAGSCLVLASKDSNSDEYISVILKSPTRDELYSNMNILLGKIPQ